METSTFIPPQAGMAFLKNAFVTGDLTGRLCGIRNAVLASAPHFGVKYDARTGPGKPTREWLVKEEKKKQQKKSIDGKSFILISHIKVTGSCFPLGSFYDVSVMSAYVLLRPVVRLAIVVSNMEKWAFGLSFLENLPNVPLQGGVLDPMWVSFIYLLKYETPP